jgi:hypothetical protein
MQLEVVARLVDSEPDLYLVLEGGQSVTQCVTAEGGFSKRNPRVPIYNSSGDPSLSVFNKLMQWGWCQAM